MYGACLLFDTEYGDQGWCWTSIATLCNYMVTLKHCNIVVHHYPGARNPQSLGEVLARSKEHWFDHLKCHSKWMLIWIVSLILNFVVILDGLWYHMIYLLFIFMITRPNEPYKIKNILIIFYVDYLNQLQSNCIAYKWWHLSPNNHFY